MKGHVYIIKSDEGPIKIGISINHRERIAGIISASGRYIVERYVSPKMDGYEDVEKRMHAAFAQYRRPGEWFDVDFNVAVGALRAVGLLFDSAEWMVSGDYVKAALRRDKFMRFMGTHPNSSDEVYSAYLEGDGERLVEDIEFAFACEQEHLQTVCNEAHDHVAKITGSQDFAKRVIEKMFDDEFLPALEATGAITTITALSLS